MSEAVVSRVLSTLNMMTGMRLYSIGEIAKELGVRPSTVYRYINVLEECDFQITKVGSGKFHVHGMPPNLGNLSTTTSFCFGQEEARVLLSAVNLLDDSLEMKAVLREKILSAFKISTQGAPTVLFSPQKQEIVQVLSDAMQKEMAVQLHGYMSARSNRVKSYIVEPSAFSANYEDVEAFDCEEKKMKTFKIARIGSVEMTRERWRYVPRHRQTETDDFRMSGDDTYHVLLRMNLRAKSLLVEENPSSESKVRRDGPWWYYEADVKAVEGVGRFIAGLLDEVDILEGDEVRDYVKGYVERGLSKMMG